MTGSEVTGSEVTGAGLNASLADAARTLLFRDAHVIGGDLDRVDVLIRAGRVAWVGRPGAAPRVSGVEEIDLDGRHLGHSMRDNHVHFSQWALVRSRVDLAAAQSARHACRILADAYRASGSGSTSPRSLVGYGFRDAGWPDSPTAALLDEVSPEVEVVLISADLHCVWLNTRALVHHGYADHPSGLLREQDAIAVTTRLAETDTDELARAVPAAIEAAARRGVTEIVDLEWADNVRTWTDRVQAGMTGLRVVCGVYPDDLEEAIRLGLRTDDVLDNSLGLLRMGPLKVIVDGSLNTRTAYCFDPYPDDGFGQVNYDPDSLTALVRRSMQNGITPAIHAIGDAAVRLALDAMESAPSRGWIEHAQLIADEDFARFARLGVVASIQPEHLLDDRVAAESLWANRTRRAYAFRSLHDAGARLALGSDAPVAPLDPWITMAAAVFRSEGGGASWHPEQCLSPEVAYAASTNKPNPIADGDRADLVITEADPLRSDARTLRSMPVAATLLGGVFTYSEL